MPHPNDRDFEERVLASVVHFLVTGREDAAASVFLSCDLQYSVDLTPTFCDHYDFNLWITCDRSAYDILSNPANAVTRSIGRAFRAVLPANVKLRLQDVRCDLIDIDANWRIELLEIARGRGVSNQLSDDRAPVRIWNNLRFRSQSEIRIANALDQAGVFFLPNCKGRLSTPSGRENREADFLVCLEGKWGILEVDGEPFHPPSRTVQDHDRDRLFKAHGIRVVEHFDASECFENATTVVARFLDILARS